MAALLSRRVITSGEELADLEESGATIYDR
jgi:hypothetical protein